MFDAQTRPVGGNIHATPDREETLADSSAPLSRSFV